MTFVTCDLMTSLDGFVSGTNQTRERPFGDGDIPSLHRWMFEDGDENRAEIDDIVNAGAFIMGRNMFGPDRGPFDLEWTGWWGPEPPYHGPVFVLTHFEREPFEMEGGTSFTFVTGGPIQAMELARDVVGSDGRISVAGGASTANQYLEAGLIDELRLHVTPVLLGAGERLFEGVTPRAYELVSSRSTSHVTHVTYRTR